VLVTFERDPERLAGAVTRAAISMVQLHGFQTPSFVRTARHLLPPGVTIIKALHIDGASCIEQRFLGQYERAGTDWLLLDNSAGGTRVGSTGQTLDAATARAVVDASRCPFMLAGGLSLDNRAEFADLIADPRYVGADIDSHARDHRGELCHERVAPIVSAWHAREGRSARPG
jgi:phosphoribosylanthranilate isomerase